MPAGRFIFQIRGLAVMHRKETPRRAEHHLVFPPARARHVRLVPKRVIPLALNEVKLHIGPALDLRRS